MPAENSPATTSSMSSLQELLAREGFQRRNTKRGRRRHSAAAPPSIYLCRHRGNVDVPRRNVDSRTSDWLWRQEDPNPAARSVVSILSGYLDRFAVDFAFRQHIRERCSACLQADQEASTAALIANLEAAIESVERIAEEGDRVRRRRRSEIKDSVRSLNLVASGEQINSSVAACAQIYLAIIYKMEGDDRAAARRLLQAFSEAPALARRNLMPDLWEIFFLPHLLHLQAWYQKEAEATLAKEDENEREERIKDLDRVYNDQIDVGTVQFAMYYKDWIKLGLSAPQPPSVELPPAATLQRTPEKSSPPVSSSSSGSNLHQAIFLRSSDRDGSEDHLLTNLATGIADKDAATEDGASNRGIPVHSTMGIRRRENSTPTPARKSSYSLRFFTCRSEDPNKSAILPSTVTKSIAPREASSNPNLSIPELNNLLSTITSSGNLPQCEAAIREIAKLWIDSHGDQFIESSLSTVPAIEGLMEISFSSTDPQILDVIICLLAELAARNESNGRAILNADPQLEIFLKLMNIHQLFLKASILLYLLKPKAKQMLSSNWVPLVLRILELGDRKLTLFSIQCRAKSAGFYLLDQLLTGFDVDRNVENAKQVVSQGGLRLLMRRMEMGEARERKLSAALLTACVRADGSCREFLAAHLSKAAILELLLGNQLKSKGSAISLLAELMKLNRRTQITMFLNDLKNEGCLNTMHILFVYLQQASSDQRPLVAAILLQLDLLGDNLQHSIYREEGIDALVMALDCKSSKKVQENCARALLMLGGRFSSSGESLTEAEMLKRAGFDDNPGSSFCSKDFEHRDIGNLSPGEDGAATEDWQRSLALVLLSRGKKRLLGALASCMAEGIPSLSRSSLVTVAWMSFSLSSSPLCASLWSPACPVLLPQLIRCLNYDVAVEERVLACFSLLNLCRNPECRSKLTQLDEQSTASLNDLAWLTWTARELIMMGASDSMSFMKI